MPRALATPAPVLCLLGLLALAQPSEAPAQSAGAGAVAVAAVRADAPLDALAAGTGLWLQQRLAEAGFEPIEVTGSRREARAAAASSGHSHLLEATLRARDGQSIVQLVIVAPANGKLLGGARSEAPIAGLGSGLARAANEMLHQLGARELDVTPPVLDDLASSSRALEARAAGQYLRAWRAVQGKLSPTAMQLRGQIVEEARRGGPATTERARVLAATGDVAGAWRLISRAAGAALKDRQPDPQVLLAAAEVSLARNDLRMARRYADLAARHAPEDADVRRTLARILTGQGDLDGARREIARAAALEPEDPTLYEQWARLETGRPQQAAVALLAAGDGAARRLDPHRARRHYARAAALDPGAAAQAGAGTGALEEQLGRPAEALVGYRQAMDGGLAGPQVLVAMGRSQRALGQTAGAEASLKRALAIEPRHAGALAELGAVYLDANRPQEARPLLESAHDVDRANARTRRRLALALQASGDSDRAVELLLSPGERAAPDDLLEAARIELTRGNPGEAARHLERATALDPIDPQLQRQYALALEASGRGEEAAFARDLAGLLGEMESDTPASARTATGLSLDELVRSFAAQVGNPTRVQIISLDTRRPDDWRTWAYRVLWPRRPDTTRIDAAIREAIEARFSQGRLEKGTLEALDAHLEQLYDFDDERSLSAQTIASVNQVLGTGGVFLARVIADPLAKPGEEESAASVCSAGAYALEVRLLRGRSPDIVSILANTECLDGGDALYGTWNEIAGVLYALLAIFILRPLVRGWGTVHVSIRLPEKTKGFFSIHITTRPDQVKRELVDKKTGREKLVSNRKLDFLKRFERHMAGRETPFRWIPARGEYTVTVGGPLLDSHGEDIIGHFLEEQKVRVRRGALSKLVFDFRPKECAVEVTLAEDGEPIERGRVAVQGDLRSLRYTREGKAFLYLGMGEYTLIAGSNDSAAKVAIDVVRLDKSIPLTIDFGRGEGVVFRGCPEAVEPYLQGDLATAADALQMSGDATAAHAMRAALFRRQGRSEDAAREFEAAGHIEDAAELRATGEDFEGSAALFEQAGDHTRAAETYRAAGQFADAARCYEQVYDYHNALECWREVGDAERELLLLEKLGEYMEAAAIAREQGQLDRAISNLQQIDQRHGDYTGACRLIAEIVSDRGDHDLAVAKFEEAIAQMGAENASVELLEGYAGVLERAGRPQEAVSAYEALRRRDASRVDVQTRIETLRRAIGESEQAGPQTAAVAAPAAQTEPMESRYELIEEIGRGGMGVVYKARDTRLGRVVALKQLPENLREHPNAVALFEREARAAASLNHPNIVTLFDAGQERGSYFITMELLEGRALNQIMERQRRLSVRDVARLGVQICAGLQYAHKAKIVHRDIKTANLFFTREQVVKIMDFGIAKSMEEVRRSTTIIGGTPYYMAPEQAAGSPVDHRADLYALGVTLFQLATGSLPFADGDVTYRHAHEAPPDPREVELSIPEALSRLILALIEKRPDDRPGSAAEAGAALRELL